MRGLAGEKDAGFQLPAANRFGVPPSCVVEDGFHDAVHAAVEAVIDTRCVF